MSDIDDELFALAGGDEEAEEGEASDVAPSSPNSLGSGAMDESDSDNDDSYHRDSAVPYPLEGKYIDEADKRRIESMSLLERERVLGDRAEEMQHAKFNAELARRAKERESEVAQNEKKKRKASSIEPEDSQRKSSRQKTKTSDKLEAYKREREQRGQLRQRQDDRRRRRHSSTDSRRHASDVDADGESEVDWDEQARQAAAAREEALPPTLAHFEAVRANRAYFYKVCFYPGFEQAVVGAFARIGVGQDTQRRTLYKMAQIKDFMQGKPYTFDGPNGDKRATDQYLVVQHGSVKKEYNFNFLSNSSFTESEFAAYKQSIAEANIRLPTRSYLDGKLADIRKMENLTWDDKAISEKLAKQNKYIHLVDKEKARQSANRPTHVDQTAQRLDEINKQNRKANSEQIRKALIEERRAELRARKMKEREFLRKKAQEEAKAKAQEEAAKAKLLQVPNSETDALFDGSERSRSATPAVGDGTSAKKEKRTGIPTFRKRKMDDDIISSLDLGIDIEI